MLLRRVSLAAILLSAAIHPVFGQAADKPPKFEAADVHVTGKTPQLPAMQMSTRAGRYEIKYATMVGLINTAYGFPDDKILGGPSWLEMDHFDVIAKLPEGTTADNQKLMLQALLTERFHLVLHKDTKPLPSYALIAPKKPQLKEAAGTEEPGCKVDTDEEPGGNTILMGANVAAAMGVPARLHLGPGGTIRYRCKNMTMASFAENLRGMLGANLGSNPIVDDTKLKGAWNFDIRWSYINSFATDTSEHITAAEAVEKQLGLKLEERQVPTPVIVVDSVDEKPIANPPETTTLLPPVVIPTAFEVASVKAAEPGGRGGGLQIQPGGRVTGQGAPMRVLLLRAFDLLTMDELAEVPGWVDSERFDITAKAPSADPSAPPLPSDAVAPLLRNLLKERFKLAYHTEDRPMTAYSLVAAKPKLKKADPASRAFCKFPNTPAGSPPGSRLLVCQNVTLAQFAERLQRLAPELSEPVLDATGVQGTWDLSLLFSQSAGTPMGGRGGVAAPAAADPNGASTLFEALEKQLGLKLEKQKRPISVIVIDHLEQKPTEN